MELGAVPRRNRAWIHGVAVSVRGQGGRRGVRTWRQWEVALGHGAMSVGRHWGVALVPGGSLQGPGPKGRLGQGRGRGLTRGGGTVVVEGVTVIVVRRVHRRVEGHELPLVRLVRAPAEELVAAPPQLRPERVHHHGLADAAVESVLGPALVVLAALKGEATGLSRRKRFLVNYKSDKSFERWWRRPCPCLIEPWRRPRSCTDSPHAGPARHSMHTSVFITRHLSATRHLAHRTAATVRDDFHTKGAAHDTRHGQRGGRAAGHTVRTHPLSYSNCWTSIWMAEASTRRQLPHTAGRQLSFPAGSPSPRRHAGALRPHARRTRG